ncbi:MAG: NUDIX hydrolase [Anaerolineaceae bacterium]|nr:NUDIX hydrolase [Anaerolineaceae bacterium]
MKEIIVSKNQIHVGSLLSLEEIHVELPNGQRAQRDLVRHPGAVALVAIDENGMILLVEQFRIAAGPEGSITLEIPAGTLQGDEVPIACAERELREETGYRAEEMQPLGGFYLAPGYSTEYIHLFSASRLVHDPLPMDADEFIRVKRLKIAEALREVRDRRISDAKTIIGILRAAQLSGIQ